LIHLTLAFVGAQPAIRVDSLRRLAGLVRASSFVLALDKVGGFQAGGHRVAGLDESSTRAAGAATRPDRRAADARIFRSRIAPMRHT